MKILITGATGLVGSLLVDSIKDDSQYKLLTPEVQDLDIANREAIEKYIAENVPDTIIHFAAHTDLNAAEEQRGDEEGSVWKINVEGTKNLVEAAEKTNSYLIHISTDYVFSGRADDPGPYTKVHPVETNLERLSWYGYTKMQAEQIVKDNLRSYAIIRINNPVRTDYDLKPDAIKKILIPYDLGKELTLFNDQKISITSVASVTEVIKKLLQDKKTGIFHVASENTCTPYELASYILEKARGAIGVVKQSSIEDYYRKTGLLNRYTHMGGLNVESTEDELDIKFGTWQEIVDKIIQSEDRGL